MSNETQGNDDYQVVELLSEAAHEAWMETKRQQGITSRNSEWGEDLMVPYCDLTEQAKDLDRGTVRGVLAAIERAGMAVVPAELVEACEQVRTAMEVLDA